MLTEKEKEKRREYYWANKEAILVHHKKYYCANKEKITGAQKQRYIKDRDRIIAYQKEYRKANKARVAEYRAAYYQTNRDSLLEKALNYQKLHLPEILIKRSTPKKRVSHAMSLSIHHYLKAAKNHKHWEDMTGYTLSQLRKHLERGFLHGMTWDNYGKEWHIDHIIPVSAFNFTSAKDIDFKRCWALKNLRPLWKIDNHRKSDKIESPFQPALQLAV